MYSPTDSKHIRICTSDNYIDNICRNIETSVPSSFIHHIFGINEPNGFQTQSKYCVNKTRRQHHFYKLIFDYFSTTHRHTHTHFIDSRGLFQVFFFHIFDIDADPDELVILFIPTAHTCSFDLC